MTSFRRPLFGGEADIGFSAGKHMGMIYKNGEPYRRIGGANMLEEFLREIDLMVAARAS